ncbi:NADP-dependent oxidoreductase [Flavobacterium sp. 3HN19-14]|uniref:NADP-dependent oxidoreductase n=1 Tax=Flavobacterium sp. 3HN19-14 TaxID=3448133 RepID=UPI003EE30DE2
MKAIIINEAGGSDQLQFVQIPQPIAAVNEILVKVKALSINPVDVKTRSGKAFYTKLKEESKPLILGWDISGIVEAVGSEVTAFKPGDEVFSMVNFPGHGNAYAEYVAAPANQFAKKPANISHEEAAAATLAALTAYQVLKKHVKSGDHILIHAAAGGVGHFAVQIAKIMDVKIAGTASATNFDYVKSLGADQVIDYTKTNFEDEINNLDFVLDSISGEQLVRSVSVTKKGGTVLSLPSNVITDEARWLSEQNGVKVEGQLVESNGEDMKQLAEWLESGQLKATVSEIYDFKDMAKAHESIEKAKTRGKIVVTI